MSDRAAPYVLGPGERRGPVMELVPKASSPETAGGLFVFEALLPARTANVPLHVHSEEDEANYVLEGVMTYVLGNAQVEAGAGSFAWLPRGHPHALANLSDASARVLAIATPGGLEQPFAEQYAYFVELAGAPPDPARLQAIFARAGTKLLGPPLRVPA